jgi:hypothetical protein
MDAVDYWKPARDQAQEESDMLKQGFISGRAGGQDSDAVPPDGMVGTESSPLSGQMDTSVAGRNPSYT